MTACTQSSCAKLQATPQIATSAATPAATAEAKSAQAPLNKLDQLKLREADGLRKAANKTIDAVRLGASNVYEAAAALGAFQGKFPVRQQDLLVTFPADEAHVPLIQAGRQWHKVVSPCHLAFGVQSAICTTASLPSSLSHIPFTPGHNSLHTACRCMQPIKCRKEGSAFSAPPAPSHCLHYPASQLQLDFSIVC